MTYRQRRHPTTYRWPKFPAKKNFGHPCIMYGENGGMSSFLLLFLFVWAFAHGATKASCQIQFNECREHTHSKTIKYHVHNGATDRNDWQRPYYTWANYGTACQTAAFYPDLRKINLTAILLACGGWQPTNAWQVNMTWGFGCRQKALDVFQAEKNGDDGWPKLP